MSANFHPIVYIIDYILGIVMWTLVGRVAMNIFQREDSQFFFMRVFVKFTNPLLTIFKPLTPSFIIQPLVPLYVAWFFFMIRFYLAKVIAVKWAAELDSNQPRQSKFKPEQALCSPIARQTGQRPKKCLLSLLLSASRCSDPSLP